MRNNQTGLGHPCGEEHWKAKATRKQAVAIWRLRPYWKHLWESGCLEDESEVSYVARVFSLNYQIVCGILRGHNWRHLHKDCGPWRFGSAASALEIGDLLEDAGARLKLESYDDDDGGFVLAWR